MTCKAPHYFLLKSTLLVNLKYETSLMTLCFPFSSVPFMGAPFPLHTNPQGSFFQVPDPATQTATATPSNIRRVPETQARAEDCVYVPTLKHPLATAVTKFLQVNQTQYDRGHLSS